MTDSTSPPPQPPRVVLDTNVLLDWRVFKDPLIEPVARAIAEGRVVWVATQRMLQEWHLVWPRPGFARWQPDREAAKAAFEPAVLCDEPPRGPLRCKDPDDQMFIDLSLHLGARWLLTKDAALLKLARRARTLGCEVLPPAALDAGCFEASGLSA